MLGEVLRFCIVGVLAAAIHYVVYLVMKHWMAQVIAFAIGYFVSFVANFFLSAWFTFKKDATMRKGAGFFVAHAVNFLLQTSLLQLFVWCGIDDRLAPILVYCIAVPVNFLMVRFVFRH